jgi:hypothetical protein
MVEVSSGEAIGALINKCSRSLSLVFIGWSTRMTVDGAGNSSEDSSKGFRGNVPILLFDHDVVRRFLQVRVRSDKRTFRRIDAFGIPYCRLF